MHDWPSTIALAAQALFAVIAVDQLRRSVFPALHTLRARALITDVWAPLAIVLPTLFFLSRTQDSSVHGAAWVGIGGPIACALVGLGGALIVNRPSFATISFNSIAVWSGAGVVLLLLGAAHHLTLWVGQCAFALAAVLLWVNTPDEGDDASQSATHLRAGLGMMVAVVAAAFHGAASIFVPEHLVAVSGTIVIASAAMVMTAAARFGGSDAAMRIGGWTIAYGILLALGVLSLLKLIPATYQAAKQGVAPPIQRLAHGFGEYWIESLIALTFAGAALTLMRVPPMPKRMIGMALIAAAAILAAWRLSKA